MLTSTGALIQNTPELYQGIEAKQFDAAEEYYSMIVWKVAPTWQLVFEDT